MLTVVLSDGVTWGELADAALVEVPDGSADEQDAYTDDGRPVAPFSDDDPFLELNEDPADGFCFAVVLDDDGPVSELAGCRVVDLPEFYDGEDPVADGDTLAEF